MATRYATGTDVPTDRSRNEIEKTLRRYGHLFHIHPYGCWEWIGTISDQGYGIASTGKTATEYAHRLIYRAFRGEIPTGLDLDHRCHGRSCAGGPECPHRRCVNPAHLVPSSRQENLHRGVNVTILAHQAGTCIRGHEMDLANTYISPKGQRHCQKCRRRREAERRQRRASSS